MATILQSSFLNVFLERKFFVLIQILPKIIAYDKTVNKSALIKVMVWRRTGDKPLPEPMMTQFLRHLCEMTSAKCQPFSSDPNVLTMR